MYNLMLFWFFPRWTVIDKCVICPFVNH